MATLITAQEVVDFAASKGKKLSRFGCNARREPPNADHYCVIRCLVEKYVPNEEPTYDMDKKALSLKTGVSCENLNNLEWGFEDWPLCPETEKSISTNGYYLLGKEIARLAGLPDFTGNPGE